LAPPASHCGVGTRHAPGGAVIGNIPDDGLTRSGGATLNVTSVPEPASRALLLAGFGMIGYAMRRRGTAVVSAWFLQDRHQAGRAGNCAAVLSRGACIAICSHGS